MAMSVEERKKANLAATRRWRERNIEKARAANRAQYHKDIEVWRERGRRYRASEKGKAWREANREKNAAYMQEYNRQHAERLYLQGVERKFGLAPEEYLAMRERQRGLCAICQRPPQRQRLAVDHCHVTGKVRGLLCGKCNKGIGLLDEHPGILDSAKAYLERHARP